MGRVAIVTDSVCCLPTELVEKYRICVVPLIIIHKGNSYRDGVDITPTEVYKIMRRRKELPTTSTPSAGDFLNAFWKLSEEADAVVCITLTSLQSKTFESACVGRDKAAEVIPNTPVVVIDSRAVAGALGFIALEAARVADRGASLDEVVAAAHNMIPRVHHIAMVDTLYYLARTGRIARAAAWAGSLLNMKPVLEHSTQVGETTPVARPRTTARAIELMLGLMAKMVGDRPVHVIAHHADEPVEGEKLKAEIASRFNCVETYLTEFTPGMGVHAGPGILGMSFYTD
jgi:DegV family protein with EDD domain